jgi:hypothetical protein
MLLNAQPEIGPSARIDALDHGAGLQVARALRRRGG